MAARTNKRDPRAARTLRRISFVREVKQSFLIICEGVNAIYSSGTNCLKTAPSPVFARRH